MRGLKYQIMSLLKIKDYSQPKHFKTIYSGGKKRSKLKKKQSLDNIIKNIRNLFKIKRENKAANERIIRDIKTFFEQQEEDY